MPESEQHWNAGSTEDHPKRSGNTKTKSSRAGTSRKQAINQTLSCAECRRLKLRCDRVFPCGSCQKRGIAELCPEGSLPTRNKPVTSSTDKEQLYLRVSELRGRVLELEKALETAHAAISPEPHPLLSDESFTRKSVLKRRKVSNDVPDDEDNDENEESSTLDEALGSLNVGEEGRARFFGRSACVERLFKYQNNGSLATPEEPNILVSAEVAMIYQSFPLLTIGEATGLVQERIWRHLPPLQRAEALRQSYRRNAYHITDIIPLDSWFDELFSRVYQNVQPADVPLVPFSESGVRIDELALLFAYFGMGALMDVDLTPFNYEAEAYACLSRAALTSMNVLKNPTVITVETLILLGYFEAMWGEIVGSGDAWIITAMATKLAQLIGVHRNIKQFGLPEIEVERRSRVYWELYTLELMEGLSHGRPSTFSLIPSDVDMPSCVDPKTDLHAFRYRLAADCLAPLSQKMFTVKMPSYTAVVELDRKIRKFCADFGIGLPGQNITFSSENEADAMRNYTRLVFRESTLLYLHRAFFARAVTANPSDPQHTKYGLSVSGAYDSAMTLVQAIGEIYQYHPATSSRALLCWGHTLCSVFILGSITTHCPGSRLAPLAAKRLHDVNELYQRASTHGGRALADRPLVTRMAEKCLDASKTYAVEHSKTTRGLTKGSASPGGGNEKREQDEGEDELALVGGYTRLVKISKESASPVMSTGPVPSGYSPGLAPRGYSPDPRNVSPASTDTSSLPDPTTDQHRHWEGAHLAYLGHHDIARSDGQASSPLHLSSGGSASSGLSPGPSSAIVTQQDSMMHIDAQGKTFETPQMQHRGVPGYEYINGLPDQGLGHAVYNGDYVRIVEDPGEQHLYQHQFRRQNDDYVPMEVSTGGTEPQEWNFLDNWYGHVFQLDVIPPDYGKAT